MVLSMWTLFTVSSDGCCGCCCTGPHRAALLICPNAITIVMGVLSCIIYYYGTQPQISHWNENGIVGTLPNNVVIPYVFGDFVDFKWSIGLWLWACSIGLHGVALIIAVLGLCCWHELYIPEDEEYGEDWDESEYYDDYYENQEGEQMSKNDVVSRRQRFTVHDCCCRVPRTAQR